MMRLISDTAKAAHLSQLLWALCATSLVTLFGVALVSGQKTPILSEVIFGVLPMLALGVMVTVLCLQHVLHERLVSTFGYAIVVMSLTTLVAVAAAFTGIWNAGSSLVVLTPGQAVLSLASLGLWPMSFGPDVSIRFLPLVFGLGLYVRLKRAELSVRRCIGWALTIYLTMSLALHAMSWVALILAIGRRVSIALPIEVFRLLVSAQSDGYWVRLQGDRFFATLGRQAETGILATQGAMIYGVITMVCVSVIARRLPAAGALARRIATPHTARVLSAMLIGAALSLGTRSSGAYGDLIAIIVFFIVALSWVAWWRFHRDLEDVAQDEQRHPDRPLPSGLISPHVMEEVNRGLLTISLFGALLLGWPVCIGITTATLCVLVLSRQGLGWRSEPVLHILVSIFMVASLAWSGAVFGLRDVIVPLWLLRIVGGASVLVGCAFGLKLMQSKTESKLIQGGVLGAVLVVSMAFTRQHVMWLATLPLLAFLLILSQKPGRWHRRSAQVLDAALGFMVFIALFVPTAIKHV